MYYNFIIFIYLSVMIYYKLLLDSDKEIHLKTSLMFESKEKALFYFFYYYISETKFENVRV